MNPKQAVEARLEELRAQDKDIAAKRGAIIDGALTEKRGMNADEQSRHDALTAERSDIASQIATAEARLTELAEAEKREAEAAEVRKQTGQTGLQAGYVKDAPIYARAKVETSFFRDLYFGTKKGDHEALDRLRRNNAMTFEARAIGTAAGGVGEFAPPLWLVEDYVKLARAGRKFADSLDPMPLPSGVSSVNLPVVTGGSSEAVQATNNATLSQTDMTSSSVSSGITTIGGKQVVALQLLTQSGIPFDQVIGQDLAAAYAAAFDNQVINGSGSSGQLLGVYTYFNASGTVNTTYTQATPAVGGAGGFYAKIFAAAAAIEAARFLPPDTIWMHPRRWNWVLSSSDSSNRPLVVPQGPAFNAVGQADGMAAQGVVGRIGGLDVVTDPQFVTNLGAGTNQDPVLVGVRSDLKLWESQLFAESFDAPYADSAGVLFRLLAYSAAIPKRYTTSVSVISGTGLVAPSF